MLKPYVRGELLPPHLESLWRRFNPSAAQLEHLNPWTEVMVDDDPEAKVVATGKDAAGRPQRIYSPAHVAAASGDA